MPLFIGMDEAGYGPNLGPLVISATAWEVAERPQACDLWELLREAVTQHPAPDDRRLHVADSKLVFSPARGLAALETTVLCLLRWAGYDMGSFRALWRQLTVSFPNERDQEPWFVDDVPLPVAADPETLDRQLSFLTACAAEKGLGPPRVRCDLVLTEKFNRLTADHDSKGRTLSSLSLALLATIWKPRDSRAALIVADKHGGRNRYDRLLAEVLDGEMIFRVEEGRERSVYRVGRTEICFQTKAEVHFPVAVASLVSKYLRELAMIAFNRFWRLHLPDVKPTQGYPNDAKRFRADIAECQAALGIPDRVLWRER